jgi:hypothetical protein
MSLFRPCYKLLRAVSDLHIRGYQRLRIMPYVGGPGAWRCVIAPALWFSCDHGARVSEGADYEACATYTSASGREYWGWRDSNHCTPAKLAEVFLEKFPGLAEMGYGQDWLYGGWFQHMLHQIYPDSLPVV